MTRLLVIGGSGFIGTNVVERCLHENRPVVSIDVKAPQKEAHRQVFRRVDILQKRRLREVFDEFQPRYVIHLAARTYLDGKRIDDYAANTEGVRNVVHVLRESQSVERCVFTSTKLVCRPEYKPMHDTDYAPGTLYGRSKVIGEKIVRSDIAMRCHWCMARPSSIWGPWCDVPYRGFFLSIARGMYCHPGNVDPPKSFGYVGNVVHQIEAILEAPAEAVHGRTFYLSDYESYTIRQWAETICEECGRRKPMTLPEALLRGAALAGDVLKFAGVKNPPLTSFRLRNMRTDTTGIPLDSIKEITGQLPFSMREGVKKTVQWLREAGRVRK